MYKNKIKLETNHIIFKNNSLSLYAFETISDAFLPPNLLAFTSAKSGQTLKFRKHLF